MALTSTNQASENHVEQAYQSLLSVSTLAQEAFSLGWQCKPANDRRAAHLLCSGALTAYFTGWSNFIGMKAWLVRLHGLEPHESTDPLDELRCIGGQLCISRLADDDSYAAVPVESLLNRALQLLLQHLGAMDFAQALLHTPVLLECCQVLRHRAEAQELEILFTRDARFADVAPLWRGRLWDCLSAAYYVFDDRVNADRCEGEAQRLADEHSLAVLQFELSKRPVRYALEEGRLDDAERILEKMFALLNPGHLGHVVEYWDMQGRLKLARREYSAAQDAYRRALGASETGELPKQGRVVLWSMSGATQIAMDQELPALALYRRMVDESSGTQREIMACSLLIARAWFDWKAGRADARDVLEAGIREAARLNLLRFMRPLPAHAAELCHVALEAGIEPDFARRVIAARTLTAPASATSAWPYPLRIFSSGGLRVEIDGEAMPPQSKPQVKPISLLKLIAANDGAPIPVARAVATLWPDGDGDRASFDMALGRLKKLLGRDDLVYLEGGQLVADPQRVWLDTRYGAGLAEAVEQAVRENAPPSILERLTARLLRIHSASFLQHEDGAPWIIAARERQQRRFLRSVDHLGAALEAHDAGTQALRLYEKALETEPLAEDIYRRLMQCYQRQGSPAEAIRIYRRCKQMLSVMLGIPPSRETETLMRVIHGSDGGAQAAAS